MIPGLESLIGIIADKLIGIIADKLVDPTIKKIVNILGIEKEMKLLQSKIGPLKLVLDDAESKKIVEKSINHWFAELREVLYDADDLLDDLADAQRRNSNIKAKNTISKKLTEINSNLANFDNAALRQLLAGLPNADKSANTERTSPYQVDSEIVGIDDDVTDLVHRIKGNCKDHSLFAITGMCGIGKTTLARKVFHHQLIQEHFNKNTVWVCVSSNCTGEYLLKEIVRSIDKKDYSESRDSLDELSSKLIEVVKEKRVFIVLDDIWDSRVWEKFLRAPLSKAERHCRILITTRNTNVAKAMDAAHTHPMTNMLPSDGWSMLCKIVFKEETDRTNKLEKVGKEIVDRCKGLPLAINVVGEVLRMTDRRPEAWKRVLSGKTWLMKDLREDERPSLLLSYEDLPSHLKRCFIYCSLFPQDFKFYQAILLYMWIAEGFIEKEGETTMEESAKEYYNELVMRNLLQVRSDDNDGSSKCEMHDLLHSLAIFVSQNQYIYVNPKAFGSTGSIKHRHLSFNVNVDPKDIIGQEYVRTLMLSKIKTIPDLSGLRRLKVLDLGDTGIETLPDSVRNLRQLRFLNISSSEFYSLPDSIQELEKLETLIVSFLKSRSLPNGIGKLCNLRHLLVSDRPQNMPNGLDNLKNLRVLDCFVVSECTSSSKKRWSKFVRKKSEDCIPNMKELKGLSELTDLSIYNLERVASKEEAEEAAIEMKTSLKCLTLSCKPPQSTSPEDIRKIEEVFKGIEIPENLTELSIDGFFGKQLPARMGWSRLHQVKSFKLERCKLLEQLPSLGDMPKLETLHITNLSVANFGSDFVGESKFPKLQDFRLMEMEELVNMFDVEIGAFPCLVNLFISGCPKLESLGEGLQHARCLKKMTVRDVSKLESIENLSSISELEISRNEKLRSVKNLPSLKKMDINECSALEVVKDVRELSSLSISSNAEMITPPEWLKNTIASEKWHRAVTDSEELVLMSGSKRVEVKINGVKVDRNFPGASEKWHRAVTDSEELVLKSRSKRVEVKINGVKVDRNFPGASEIQFVDPVNDSISSSIMDDITKNFQEEIRSTSSSIPNPVLQPKTPSNHSVDRERIVFIMVFGEDKLIEIVLKKLVDAGIKKIASVLGVNSEMEALRRNVKNIRLVLVDLETKKIEDKAISLWLAKLREVLYDAEDLLDDFAAAQRRKSIKERIRKSKILTIIQNINSEIERLTSQILQLLTSQPNADRELGRYNGSRLNDTSSNQVDSEIVGIDDDVTDLVDRIKGDCEDHSLFAITGMCGIGKTTLARKVFHHQLIQDHFNKNTVWVCVSSNCTGEYLLKKIVRFFDVNYSKSCDTQDELSSKLIEVVKEKRVFIVLDDIWDSHILEEFLRVPLSKAEKHSRILITTRNTNVAKAMNAAHTHSMTHMLPSDGWSMLCKIVFKEEDKGGKDELEKVGKEIVDRCKGLPLAINVVGEVLKMKDRTIDAWTSVLSSTTWSMQDLPEYILPSLWLSYEDLPSHLKRCFIYCSLFPQDFNFHPTELMYMWIAEGFIHKEEGTTMEESAEEYYMELVMRNLLQVTPDSNGNSKCKMHDSLHSLATFVSQNQYIYVDPETIGSSRSIRCRHLRLNVENMNVDPKEREYVRTLMLSTNTKIEEIPDELLSGLRRLRVLDLELEGIKIGRLPEDSVGNMRHLRFLSISASEVHMLLDSIENLENLETLMIASVLKSRSLPKGIHKLRNLRHLLVSDRLQNMPNGLDNLKRLRVLDCFVVNECTGSSTSRWGVWRRKKSEDCKPNMKELKDLSELTDLSIHNLERVVIKEEAEEAAIGKKKSLKCLKLHCEPPPQISDEDISKIEEVFAGIEIPEKLTELSIDGFFGKRLPDHMGWSRLHQVKSFKLERCKLLEQLPSLGDMPKLETLHITNLSVANFGSDFVGESKFPKLQDFRLMEMEELVNMFDVEIGAFPCLVNLFISGCPKLESLGEGLCHATCLKKMTVRDLDELESIENLSSISELEISGNKKLRSVKTLPSLKKMDIKECSALEVVEDVPKLSSLSISSAAEMTILPEWLKNTIASEKWHRTVTDSEELVLVSRSKRVEVKINGVKVDSNFPGASSSSGTSREPVNDFMDVDNSR